LGYVVPQNEIQAVTENAVVRARIDEATKTEAAAVLAPNAEAIAAMREARSGKLPRFKTVDDLMRDLRL
jgi:DNA-damage-inducible protein J